MKMLSLVVILSATWMFSAACGTERSNLRGGSFGGLEAGRGESADGSGSSSGSIDQLKRNQISTLGWDGASFKGSASLNLIPIE
jgi:hypothetical protein